MTLDDLRKLEKKATPCTWRVNRVHDLWVELQHGNGLSKTMLADCLTEDDANLIAALRNAAPALIACAEALERIEAMAVRPKCICGVITGTAAIQHCAREALRRLEELK